MAAGNKKAGIFFMINCVLIVSAHIEKDNFESKQDETSNENLLLGGTDRGEFVEAAEEIEEELADAGRDGHPDDARRLNYQLYGKMPNAVQHLAPVVDPYEGLDIEHPAETKKSMSFIDLPPTTTTTVVQYLPPAPVKQLPPLHMRYRRIYNPDETTSVERHPYMAALLVNKDMWCGAVVIDNDRVLTAAHCLQLQYNNRFFREYVKMLTVRVASTNATAGGDVLRVTEIAFHPNYKAETLEFNAAILKLHKNLTFHRQDYPVEKIEYSTETNVPMDQNVTFLGWGSVLGSGGSGGQVLLQKLDLPVYDLTDCQQVYGRELVTRSNFCAGFITVPKNVCNHDAGGPAILDNKLVGILSFSSKRCDIPDQPAVFTNVGAISQWIDEVLASGV